MTQNYIADDFGKDMVADQMIDHKGERRTVEEIDKIKSQEQSGRTEVERRSILERRRKIEELLIESEKDDFDW